MQTHTHTHTKSDGYSTHMVANTFHMLLTDIIKIKRQRFQSMQTAMIITTVDVLTSCDAPNEKRQRQRHKQTLVRQL